MTKKFLVYLIVIFLILSVFVLFIGNEIAFADDGNSIVANDSDYLAVTNRTASQEKRKNERNKKIAFSVVGGVCVVALGIVSYLIFSDKRKKNNSLDQNTHEE